MATKVLLTQILVLGFTAALWWIARRDLAQRDLAPRVPPPAAPVQTADTAELEQLCATLETLVISLSRRLDAAEARLPKLLPATAAPDPDVLAVPVSAPAAEALVPEPPPETRYAPVHALLASGLSDPVEIARRTGLGRGEVDLILGLRDRRAP